MAGLPSNAHLRERFEPFYQVETMLWRVELYEREGACRKAG